MKLEKNLLKTLLSLATVVIANPALGLPAAAQDTSNSCSVCHGIIIAEQPEGLATFQFLSMVKDGVKVDDRMEVTQVGALKDLGTQLNGKVRGPLKIFRVFPGDTVSLQVDVKNGANDYAIQLKRLETEGQQDSQDNFLVWSEANAAGNTWDMWGASNPPYFTKGVLSDTEPTTLTFDILIDAATPPDVYDLEFAMPGHVAGAPDTLFYQDEHFYLEVLPEVALPGWLFFDSYPWVFSATDNDWLFFLNEDSVLWVFSWNNQTWGAVRPD